MHNAAMLAPQRRMTQAAAMLRLMLMAALLASAPAGATSRPKVPAGTWAVEYAKETCVLSHEGVGGEPSIAIRTRPMNEQHDLLLAMPSTIRTRISVRGHLDGEAAGTEWRWITTEQLTGGSKRWIMSSISASELATSARVGVVGLSAPGGFAIKAALPMIDRAMAALRLCEDDLARRWGGRSGRNAAMGAPGSRRPRPSRIVLER